jgi:hypothetical protein
MAKLSLCFVMTLTLVARLNATTTSQLAEPIETPACIPPVVAASASRCAISLSKKEGFWEHDETASGSP